MSSGKEEERGDQGHTTVLHKSAMQHRSVNTLFLHSCFIFTFLSKMDSKFKECVCFKFCMKLGKYTTEAIEMLCEALGE
jgi:hypothetical protein